MAGNFTGSNILGFEEKGLSIVNVGDNWFIGYQVVTGGGGSATFLQKLDVNGNCQLTDNHDFGKQMTGCAFCYGPFQLIRGPVNGVILVQRDGNGAGAGLRAYRMNGDGTLVYQNKILTAGTPGLAYAFHAVADGNGGTAFAWVRDPGDVVVSHFDSLGNLDWAPNHVNVCTYNSTQNSPYLVKEGTNWYVAFIDGRSSSIHTYIQKLSSTGNLMFNPAGRKIFGLDDGYGALPKLLTLSDGSILIAANHSSTGFVAQRMQADSTLLWPGYGTLVSIFNFWPNYENFKVARGDGSKTLLGWNSPGPNQRVFLAMLADNGVLIENAALVSEPDFRLWPNPVCGWLNVAFENQATMPELYSVRGQLLSIPKQQTSFGFRMDLQSIHPGIYYLKQIGKNGHPIVTKVIRN